VKDIVELLTPFFPDELNTRPETLGQSVLSLSKIDMRNLEGKIIILGIPDDRGIALNKGHLGAKEGPNSFRKAFYSLYCGKNFLVDAGRIIDAGNIILTANIATTHSRLALVVSSLLKAKASKIIVIGGGHDFSFGSYSGIFNFSGTIIPIVNYDAHFDLRPVENGQINSGTPFYRIIETFPSAILDGQALLEVGIQKDRNPQSLYQYAKKKKVGVIELNGNDWELNETTLHHSNPTHEGEKKNQSETENDSHKAHSPHNPIPLSYIDHHLNSCSKLGWKRATDPLHLSIDLDVFGSWLAPGTSASTPFGANLNCLLDSMTYLATLATVIDIAELCPPRDINDQTSRLAAGLVYRLIDQCLD